MRRLHRVVIDKGAKYKTRKLARYVLALAGRHQRIRPYTPRHNGKGNWRNQLLADEVLYIRPTPVGRPAGR